MSQSETAISAQDDHLALALRKAWRAIVPFAFVLYLFNAIDRFNLGFAILRMRESIEISSVDYGNVVSAFFLSYLIFQIPANFILQKVGARRWIAIIVIGWSLCTMRMFFVTSVTEILWLRVGLGAFEAGFFPGMIYYLSLWFPGSERARVTACFMLATAAAAVISGPISGWIVEHFYLMGHAGWRWLFIIEGVPSLALGLLTFRVLADTPQTARWLDDREKARLSETLAAERNRFGAAGRHSLRQVIASTVLWKLAVGYMCVQGASQAAQLWLPSILKRFDYGLSDTTVGVVFGATAVFGALAMPLVGFSSDRAGERKWHTIAAMALTGIGFAGLSFAPGFWLAIVFLIFYAIGGYGYFGPYWSMPPLMLAPAGLAISIAIINSCSSLGGYLASKILGYVDQAYGPQGILAAMALMALLSVVTLTSLKVPRESKPASES
jgi:MFS family permease